VLAGCATNKGDIDATGTVSTQLTWGGGNCAKSGSEAFTIFLVKNGYGSYDMTTSAIGQDITGSVICGPEYCEIRFHKSWFNNANDLLSLDGTLTLKGEDMTITGTGKYEVFGAGADCEQVATFKGSLQS
jgi:hypothetical protein